MIGDPDITADSGPCGICLPNLVSQRHDCFDGLHGHFAVDVFFGFGKLRIGNEAWMTPGSVVAIRAMGPSIGQALRGLQVVGIFGESLCEFFKFRRKPHRGGVDRTRSIIHFISGDGGHDDSPGNEILILRRPSGHARILKHPRDTIDPAPLKKNECRVIPRRSVA